MENLLKKLKEARIRIALNGNDIDVRFDGKTIPAELLKELKQRKQEIIAYLKERTADNDAIVISVQEKPTKIPLSFNQDRLWFLDKLHGTVNYHLASVIKLKGTLNTQALETVFRTIVNRHEILRTIYLEKNGIPYQEIMSKNGWKFDFFKDVPQYNKSDIQNAIATPFNLSKDHMLRIGVLRLSENEHILIIVMHHIASDGWSVPIFINEFATLYKSQVQNTTPSIVELPIQFSDYAIWEKEEFQKNILPKKLAYWKNQLLGVAPLDLQTDFPRPKIQSTNGSSIVFSLGKTTTAQLKRLAKRCGTTTYVTLLTIFKIVLHKYTDQEDICVGTPVANRAYKNTEGLIGYYVNTLALRSQINPEMRFLDLIKKVKETVVLGFENEDVPFEKIVKEVVNSRDLGRNPIFQVMFAFQNYKQDIAINLPNLIVSTEPLERSVTKFDLSCNVSENDTALNIELEYCTDLYKEDTVQQLFSHYNTLIQHILEEPEKTIASYTMVSVEEQNQIKAFNETFVDFTEEKNIVAQFIENAQKFPNRVALTFEGKNLTYKELNLYSDTVAREIVTTVNSEKVAVGICLERSLDMVIGLLGILKAGCVYIPIDPEYPTIRKEFIINDANIAFVLTDETTHESLKTIANTVKTIQACINEENIHRKAQLPEIALTDTAYIIYTSGTTGTPKGVINSHGGLLNRLEWAQSYFKLEPEKDVVLQKTTFCFDVSVWEFFWPLAKGIRLVLATPEGHRDNEYLQKLIEQEHITTLHFVPSMLETFLIDWTPNVTHTPTRILCSGEALEKHQILLFKDKLETYNTALFNLYGPTEAAIDVTCWKVPLADFNEKSTVVIGSPVSNTQIHILDTTGNTCGIGVLGELTITGTQVAEGYLNRPELTKERFIELTVRGEDFGKAYKTGDIARWLPDGTIEYIGRNDDQVKIRGNRIELGEIKKALTGLQDIKQAEVIAKKHNNTKVLVGYIVSNVVELDKSSLRTTLAQLLPDYMLPHFFIEIDKIPLTSNGKLNRNALPEIDENSRITKEYEAASTTQEKTLIEIWEQILTIKNIGIKDNFFELGGDSIMVIQVVSKLKSEGYYIHPRDMFVNQTVQTLARVLKKGQSKISAEQGILKGEVPLLPIQQHFFAKEPKTPSHFNQSILLEVHKKITQEDIAKVVAELYQQHDALRMQFVLKNNEWKQYYTAQVGNLETVILQDHSEENFQESLTSTCDKFQKSLNLEKGKVAVFTFLKTPKFEQNNRLLIVIHHLVTDGVSWRIILNTLIQNIEKRSKNTAYKLPQKSSSYREWSQQLQENTENILATNEVDFWTKLSEGTITLPVDKHAEKRTRNTITHTNVTVSKEITEKLLKKSNEAFNTTINDLLLSALALTLQQWTGNDTHVVGLEGHGRETDATDKDLTETIGWFTALYPVKISATNKNDLGKLIKQTKEHLRSIPNKGLGYGCLHYLSDKTKLPKQPWQIIFNYLGKIDTVNQIDTTNFSLSDEAIGTLISEDFPVAEVLEINGVLEQNKLTFICNFSTEEYHIKTIEKLMHSLRHHLETIVTYCVAKKNNEKTPSDFGLQNQLTLHEWDAFFDKNNITEIESLYALSPLQEGILFHKLYDKDNSSYLEQLVVNFAGKVDVKVFEKAWNKLTEQHSILRTNIVFEQFSTPIQIVHHNVTIPFEIIKENIQTTASKKELIDNFLRKDQKRGFDFNQAPLFRITLFDFGEEHKMVFSFHHIIMDGWSLPVMMEEFINSYENLLSGAQALPVKIDKYKDYIDYIKEKDHTEEKAFWNEYLSGFNSPSLLPFVKDTLGRNKSAGTFSSTKLCFDKKTTTKIKNYAQKNHVTVNTIVQGAWAFLLSKYANTDDVLYGVTVSGRPADLSNTSQRIGLYINTIPFRAQLNTSETIISWLSNLQLTHATARDFQYNSLGLIKDITGINQDLFDSILVFENYPISKVLGNKSSLNVNDVFLKEETNYLLTIIVLIGEELEIRFKHKNLLESVYVEKIKNHFKEVIENIVLHEITELEDLEFLTTSEKTAMSFLASKPLKTENKEETILQLFQKQVLQSPTKIALLIGDKSITYSDLELLSNKMAYYLEEHYNITKGDYVGLKLERSEYLIISLIATLKLGGTYVPLDKNYPESRIAYIVEDSNCKIILDQDKIDEFLKNQDHYSQKSIEVEVQSEDVAYIIYTSGSTGKPKGVMVSHGNLGSFLSWCLKEFQNVHFDTIYAATSHSFDISIFEMFYPLIVGKTMRIIRSGVEIGTSISTDQRVFLNTVPSALDAILDQGVSLQNVVAINLAGEPIPYKLVEKLAAYNHLEFRNLYGPSEDTIYSSCYAIDLKKEKLPFPVPMGKAIDGTQIYILDKQGALSPYGVIGEMYLGGKGVAMGYLNRPELTQDKFVENPFCPGEKMYRTGDFGKRTLDGNIEFIGRKDDQVKVRGFRIELSEISNTIEQHPNVEQAITLVKQDKFKTDYLIAFIVPKEGYDQTELKNYLQRSLPNYMVPTAINTLSKLPLTPNGKVDKIALSNFSTNELVEKKINTPRSITERKLLNIWKDFLTIQDIDVYDSFFDVGGHSLIAIRILPRINKEFQIKLDITDLFQYTTIHNLGNFIDEQKNQGVTKEKPAIEKKNREVNGKEIAIIGMSCRLPKSNSVEDFWENLKGGVECIADISEEDLKKSGISPQDFLHPKYVKRRGIVEDIDLFDAEFFGIPPAEAEIMDPQSRIFLECCNEVISKAGYNSHDDENAIGLFAGSGYNQYLLKNILPNKKVQERVGDYALGLLNSNDYLASRVAYKLNLKGPVSTVQTACSTSLVAVHHACESLRNGDADMALAGGVSFAVPNQKGYFFEEGMIGSSDGSCRAFDEKADGTVGSDGCVVLMMKMLDRAVEDGDQIYAVIKQTAINNDGSNKTGYTAPSIEGQKRVIEKALAKAGVNPTELSYIETHGTGTKLGDPIEFSALNQVFRKHTEMNNFCALGAVKTNIGHTDTASGAAGLLKAVLSLHHKKLVPTLNYNKPNSYIDIDNSPFYVNTALKDWESSNGNLKAGVSSFGIGGVNAHVILEQAPEQKEHSSEKTQYLVVLAAKKEAALQRMQEELKLHLEKYPTQSLADIAYTLQLGRKGYAHRKAFIVENKEALSKLLSGAAVNRSETVTLTFKEEDSNINALEKEINKVLLEQQKGLEHKKYTPLNDAFKTIFEKYEVVIHVNKATLNAEALFNFYLKALWEANININWSLLYTNETRKRLLLPIHPQDKKRYWIAPEKVERTLEFNADVSTIQNPEEWTYQTVWKKGSFELTSLHTDKKQKTYLVFENSLEFSQDFISALTKEGNTLIRVHRGVAFQKKSALEYVINPAEPNDYKELVTQVLKDHSFPHKIIHLWTLSPSIKANDFTIDNLNDIQDIGLYSLLYLTKALSKFKKENQELIVVSNGLHTVFPEELTQPAKATLLALIKVAPQEYEHLQCKSIDIKLPVTSNDTNILIKQLTVELDFTATDNMLALRGKHKWVARYEKVALKSKEEKAVLKNEGVYLITGGFGGIGLSMAHYIAKQVKAKIILLGRSAFPDKKEWSKLLVASEEGNQLTEKIKKIQAIEKEGAEVLLLTADIADESEMKAAISEIKNTHSKIDGVLHAAGVADNNLIIGQTKAKMEAVLSPKVRGTMLLKDVIPNEMDFFISCSSISSIYGMGGQLGYIAANSFLDAFTHAGIIKTGVKTINWDAWQDVGMAARHDFMGANQGLLPSEGLEIFEKVLQNQVAQVLISKIPLEKQKDKFQQLKKHFYQELESDTAENETTKKTAQKLQKTEIQETLREIWKIHLGFETIGLEDDFFDIGGDSLLAAKVIALTRKELGLEITIDDMFDYGTIEELADFMFSEQKTTTLPEIKKTARPLKVPLSYNQERLWFIDRLQGSVSYHIPIVLEFSEGVHIDHLEASFREIIKRHESLRTIYKEELGVVYQEQLAQIDWSLAQHDSVTLPLPLSTFIDQEINKPFELSKDVMLRGSLVKQKQTNSYILILVMHHIASDGWSMPILVQELTTLYNAKLKGNSANLSPLAIQYTDYALWQHKNLQGDFLSEKLAYWKQQLSGLSTLELPTDHKRPAQQSGKGAIAHYEIGKELKTALVAIAKAEGVTLYMLLLSVFKLLLHKHSGQEDICVGSPIANREDSALSNLIGYFVNTLVLRSKFNEVNTFKELLAQVKTTTLAAYAHQNVPFEKVVEQVSQYRDMSRSPLFQVMFALQNNTTISQMSLGDIPVNVRGYEHKTAKFDLSFELYELDESLHITVEYSTDLFEKPSVNRMLGHYERLLFAVTNDISQNLEEISMLSEEESHQIMHVFNDTKVDYPKTETIVSLFAKQVKKTPNSVALVFEEHKWTYQEVEDKSNQLAQYLKQKHAIQKGHLIGVKLERSEAMIIALLAVLKLGCAYVPIDPTYPEERITYIKNDSKYKVCIDKVLLDDFSLEQTKYSSTPIIVSIEANDLAYVIYTSGTTGKPKGVMVEHASIANLIYWFTNRYAISNKTVAIQLTDFTFDPSLEDIFGTLVNGGTYHVISQELVFDVQKLRDYLHREKITILNYVPQYLYELLAEQPKINSIECIIAGGEKMPVRVKEGILAAGYELYNNYGPTETTIDVLSAKMSDESITIGKPIANCQALILDTKNQLVPIGVPGELCIAGAVLARGYLNDVDLTQKKFIQHPFQEASRLYKTGDIVKWQKDGTISYIGRKDNQVKIRGFRIELEEIETAILSLEKNVQEVVVEVKERNGEKLLVAYFVGINEAEKEALLKNLKEKLPKYMIPTYFILLEAMPLTENGKVNRRLLPDIQETDSIKKEYIQPRNEVEEKLVAIWQQLLNLEQIGVQDNFFELGGDSFLAIKVLAQINASFTTTIKVADLFQFTNIEELAVCIKDKLNESETTSKTESKIEETLKNKRRKIKNKRR